MSQEVLPSTPKKPRVKSRKLNRVQRYRFFPDYTNLWIFVDFVPVLSELLQKYDKDFTYTNFGAKKTQKKSRLYIMQKLCQNALIFKLLQRKKTIPSRVYI